MKVCNDIMKRIDEADDVESFDFDIARHTTECSDCRRFAGERAALRELIGSTARVTAPVNFDAMLKVRLAEVKTPKPLAWLNAAFYLRAGAATAALVVAVFVAQYSGIFTTSLTEQTKQPETRNQATAGAPLTPPSLPPPGPTKDIRQADPMSGHTEETLAVSRGVGNRPRSAYSSPRRGAGVPLETAEEARVDDGGAIFIPGRNGGHDITVPTVSVGAQSLIYGNAGRQPQSARAVSVSF